MFLFCEWNGKAKISLSAARGNLVTRIENWKTSKFLKNEVAGLMVFKTWRTTLDARYWGIITSVRQVSRLCKNIMVSGEKHIQEYSVMWGQSLGNVLESFTFWWRDTFLYYSSMQRENVQGAHLFSGCQAKLSNRGDLSSSVPYGYCPDVIVPSYCHPGSP